MTVTYTTLSAASASTSADAIALLTNDDRNVKKLFTTYQKLADRETLAAPRLAMHRKPERH